MLADGLVDELHLFVYPLVLGRGDRLFHDDKTRIKLALASSETFSSGVLHLTYRPA
jgi:dihydrofolate reductase